MDLKKVATQKKQTSERKKKLIQTVRNAAKIRRSMLRKKKLRRMKRIDSGVAVINFNASRYLHSAMKEIAARQQRARGFFIDGFYEEALREYFAIHEDIPKRMIKIDRQNVRIQASNDLVELINHCAAYAYKQERPTSAVIDDALKLYCSKPENYLGSAWKERHPHQYEDLTYEHQEGSK